jgi:nucleoside triphosphate diphosphatase
MNTDDNPISIEDKFLRLVQIMASLRGEGGCPWDQEQTHESLKKYLIEESYEAVEAIESDDPTAISEELGDVLLQVVFHSQVGQESGRFDIGDVLDKINEKMISRHPHVFGDTTVADAQEVLRKWEEAKVEEKSERTSILEGIPASLPALLKAHRIQERAARVGFDWRHVDEVFEKLDEEVEEFREACQQRDAVAIREELGDVLFSVVNVARFISEDSENALHRTIDKFRDRFAYIEAKVKEKGQTLEETSLEEMDIFWEEAKEHLGK